MFMKRGNANGLGRARSGIRLISLTWMSTSVSCESVRHGERVNCGRLRPIHNVRAGDRRWWRLVFFGSRGCIEQSHRLHRCATPPSACTWPVNGIEEITPHAAMVSIVRFGVADRADDIDLFDVRDLVERRQDVTVGNVLTCHQRCSNLLSVCSGRLMCVTPRTMHRIIVLTHLRSPFAKDRHARTVDHKMDWFAVEEDQHLHRKCLRAKSKCRVLRHGPKGEGVSLHRPCAKPYRARSCKRHRLQAKVHRNTNVYSCAPAQHWVCQQRRVLRFSL